jgi:Ca2+-binding RTX toxin-like protein/plastocyanin
VREVTTVGEYVYAGVENGSLWALAATTLYLATYYHAEHTQTMAIFTNAEAYGFLAAYTGMGLDIPIHRPPGPPVRAWMDNHGVLQVVLQGNANVVIGAGTNGHVRVNGKLVGVLPVMAANVLGIHVQGGNGNNKIDLRGVRRSYFPKLADGAVEMFGGDGDDEMYGSEFGDEMWGEGGDDEMHGEEGDDRQYGGAGDDTQYGGDGADWQYGGTGKDEQDGGNGDDKQFGGKGNDIQNGGGGNDLQLGLDGDDIQNGGEGNDEQSGGEGNDWQYGGKGNDHQDGGKDDDWQFGGDGDDVQYGDGGNDTQYGEEGNDIQYGEEGNDIQYGGPGNDSLWGEEGNDKQDGGPGWDHYFPDPLSSAQQRQSAETMVVTPAHPQIASADVITDTEGNDTVIFSGATSGITLDLDLQNVDQVVNAAGDTVRLVGQFENFVGSAFDDVVYADALDVPRSLDGGPHAGGDVFHFDARGGWREEKGSTFFATGFGPVSYSRFETISSAELAPDLAPNDSWQFTFTQPGSYPYHDPLHLELTGVVEVKAASGQKEMGAQRVTEVSITDAGFDPVTIAIAVNDVVRWTNRGSTAHAIIGSPTNQEDFLPIIFR